VLVSTPSLLISDDDTDFRETLREVFQQRGFRTLLAGDGEQALQIARREVVHLLLTDMHMPRLSGLETIRRLRELRSSVPCILLSAKLDDLIVQQARQAAVSYLAKPVRLGDVTRLVNEAMRDAYGWSSQS
jgi:two-component system chemotaxis response regulator CheY